MALNKVLHYSFDAAFGDITKKVVVKQSIGMGESFNIILDGRIMGFIAYRSFGWHIDFEYYKDIYDAGDYMALSDTMIKIAHEDDDLKNMIRNCNERFKGYFYYNPSLLTFI